jgi:hypothetical protein
VNASRQSNQTSNTVVNVPATFVPNAAQTSPSQQPIQQTASQPNLTAAASTPVAAQSSRQSASTPNMQSTFPRTQTSQATSPQQVIPQTGNTVNTTPSPDMRASIQPESLADAIPAEPASELKQDGESPE